MDSIVNVSTKNKELAQKTVYSILFAISFAHLLNDLIQAIIPSVYPILKEKYNLSEGSFVELRDFVKKEEMRFEIFKHDLFIPSFSKTRLNMYRLGSHNNAYDAYDTLDYIADKNMYQYMDRKGKRRNSVAKRRRKSLTREYLKGLPVTLGVEKDQILTSRIKDSMRRK